MNNREWETVAWGRLTIAADQVDDLERVRISSENRLRALTEPVKIPSAGIEIDKGGKDTPEAASLEAQVEALRTAEKAAIKELERAMKAHPLGEFVASKPGVGLKTAGRLLGVIGDPLHRYDPETGEMVERTVAQLRSYCGWGDAAAQRRKKGVKANWNAEARKRVWIIADKTNRYRCRACIEQGKAREDTSWVAPPKDCSCREDGYEYRAVYDEARDKYADADISDGHRANRATRIVAKQFLKDLWLEARRVQQGAEAHVTADPSRKSEAVAA